MLEGKKVTDMKVFFFFPSSFFSFFYKGADGMQRGEKEGREMKDRGKPGRISI